VRKAVSLPLSFAVVTKSGALTTWKPLHPSGPVTGLLYLYVNANLIHEENIQVVLKVTLYFKFCLYVMIFSRWRRQCCFFLRFTISLRVNRSEIRKPELISVH